jgi:hypothetical protein
VVYVVNLRLVYLYYSRSYDFNIPKMWLA